MMFKINYLLCSFLFLSPLILVEGADSDGTSFVLSFSGWEPLSPVATLSLIVMPIKSDASCSISYFDKNTKKDVSVTKKALFGKLNEFTLSPTQIYAQINQGGSGIYNIFDPRIFVTCDVTVKLYAKLADPINGFGEIFLVPSSLMAGSKYILGGVSEDNGSYDSILILPLTNTGDSITASVQIYANGTLIADQTKTVLTTRGSKQMFTSSNVYDFNVTFVITTSQPVVLSYVVPYASTSFDHRLCGNRCIQDYSAFVPLPVYNQNCGVKLAKKEQIVMTNHHTTRVYIAPPVASTACNEIYNVTVFDETNDLTGWNQNLDKFGLSNITMTTRKELGIQSIIGQTRQYRLGADVQGDGLTANGHFLHYIPSTEEYVRETTQFYTYASNCYLEVFTDLDGANEDFITVDGQNLVNFAYTKTILTMFKKQFVRLEVTIDTFGLHTFDTNVKYAAYVFCRGANGAFDATGFLTGFNLRK